MKWSAENVAYEFVFSSPAVSCVICSFYSDGFRDDGKVAVQLLFCEAHIYKLANLSHGLTKNSLFNSYYTKV